MARTTPNNSSVDAACEVIYEKWLRHLPANEAKEQAYNFKRLVSDPPKNSPDS